MSEIDVLKKAGFTPELWEEQKDNWAYLPWPQSLKKFRIVWEVPNLSIEECYFWMLHYLRDLGYIDVKKTQDIFAAAENSAFFGVSQQRLGLQQDKVTQFLATIGKMVKDLFQLVRELRIIDERLEYYGKSMAGEEASEIVLKGIWIDMVEGGTKNPSSVYGMSREVQFTSLPDLFFSTHPRKSEDVDRVVETERGDFNKSVKNVLKRKLKTFAVWKEKTFKELHTRRIFTLKYLKQHYEVIKMYLVWIRPYLRHIRRMTLDEEKILTPDIVSAFEGSMIEIELLASRNPGTKHHKSCILAHFMFRTQPSMSYQQEGYQRGPIHVGKMEMNIRAYSWTDKDIENYLNVKKKQDFELMKSISESVKAAMESLGEELEKYLTEAETSAISEEKKKPSFVDRFKAEFLGPKAKEKKEEKIKMPKYDLKQDMKKAKGAAKADLFLCFKNFKKSHGMIMW
ncbi:hypothetical protein KY317_01925 [Candidatus Woesearchaeota archaeon]|nr:hypothetical protein [Candidatus Woesearchaeota archaeon]